MRRQCALGRETGENSERVNALRNAPGNGEIHFLQPQHLHGLNETCLARRTGRAAVPHERAHRGRRRDPRGRPLPLPDPRCCRFSSLGAAAISSNVRKPPPNWIGTATD